MLRVPVFPASPCACRTAHRAATLPFHDFANPRDLFALRLQGGGDCTCFVSPNRQHHADAAVERARHFARFDITLCLQEGHQRGLLPCVGVDHGVSSFGQNARNVFQQATTGDVGQRIDSTGANRRQQTLHVDPGGFDQCIDQQAFGIEQGGAVQSPAFVRRQTTDE